jgi:hypothetical protein
MKRTITFLALAASLVLAVSTARVLAGDGCCPVADKAGCKDAAKAGCPMADKNCGEKVTVTGDMVCGKCKLQITDKCQTVVQVQKDGQTVNYFLADNETAKVNHAEICSGQSKKVTAIGCVVEKDGKQILTACKIEPATE